MSSIVQFNSRGDRRHPTYTLPDCFSLAVHQEAENALSMALHYLRSNGTHVPDAARKTAQALGALNRLEMLAKLSSEPAPASV